MLIVTEDDRNELLNIKNDASNQANSHQMKTWMLCHLDNSDVAAYHEKCIDSTKIRLRRILDYNGATWPDEITPPIDNTHVN